MWIFLSNRRVLVIILHVNTVPAAIKVQIAVFILRYERVTSGLAIMVTCIPSQFVLLTFFVLLRL